MGGRGGTSARGYGWEHQQRRAAWAPRVDAGAVDCARCHRPIRPGEPWDLGHPDAHGSDGGPEHRRCNRATAGRRAANDPEPLPWTNW